MNRLLSSSWSCRCWLSIQRPECRVACASQLIPANVGEVRNALRPDQPVAPPLLVPGRTQLGLQGVEHHELITRVGLRGLLGLPGCRLVALGLVGVRVGQPVR